MLSNLILRPLGIIGYQQLISSGLITMDTWTSLLITNTVEFVATSAFIVVVQCAIKYKYLTLYIESDN